MVVGLGVVVFVVLADVTVVVFVVVVGRVVVVDVESGLGRVPHSTA